MKEVFVDILCRVGDVADNEILYRKVQSSDLK